MPTVPETDHEAIAARLLEENNPREDRILGPFLKTLRKDVADVIVSNIERKVRLRVMWIEALRPAVDHSLAQIGVSVLPDDVAKSLSDALSGVDSFVPDGPEWDDLEALWGDQDSIHEKRMWSLPGDIAEELVERAACWPPLSRPLPDHQRKRVHPRGRLGGGAHSLGRRSRMVARPQFEDRGKGLDPPTVHRLGDLPRK